MQENSDCQNLQKYQKRHNTRIIAVACLYSNIVIDSDTTETKRAFLSLPEFASHEYDEEFLKSILGGIAHNKDKIDEMIRPFVRFGVESLPPIERSILWIACEELLHNPQLTSSKIILNEAIELAKKFSNPDSYRFINAILDNVVKAHKFKN